MSLYRNTVWLFKGLREYTRDGYERAARNFHEEDMKVDCKGKKIVITGSNSGIGKVMAAKVAKLNAQVHMVCRDVQKGEQVRQEIMKQSGNNDVHLHQLDLSKLKDVEMFAASFAEKYSPIDVLINNAGVLMDSWVLTEEGVEKTFAVNTAGLHLLTKGLIKALESSPNPRVVIVSSGGMLVQKLNKDDINMESLKGKHFDGTMAYARTKRQEVELTEVYAKKYPKIWWSSMHPGWSDTPGVQDSMPSFYNRMKDRLRTPEQGADTAIWLAVSPAATKNPSGLFYQDRAPASTHLPLAWTHSNNAEKEAFYDAIENFCDRILKPSMSPQ
ncbi:unnamed protein product [Darwinula stevensoni]|uniref:Dehydrogenase/reductase SDR family member 12 n=1 Tax=Darwinula stevensoni TaxID=69355 RepID=A0A7R8X712_9CRUS|nr:unnamed protein product [Darwinula stevensoni]CAG0888618.1 unnamed protein product [Darwinula stevensoni]